jgi:hypothetical protein
VGSGPYRGGGHGDLAGNGVGVGTHPRRFAVAWSLHALGRGTVFPETPGGELQRVHLPEGKALLTRLISRNRCVLRRAPCGRLLRMRISFVQQKLPSSRARADRPASKDAPVSTHSGQAPTRPEGARLEARASLLLSATEQSHDQLSIDGNCLVPSSRSAKEREMASAARSAADRLNVQENAGPRTPRSSAAMRRSLLRHPLAELGSIAPNRLGGDPARNVILGKQSRFIE